METTISSSTWQGTDAWTLESSDLRVVTIPSQGAKLVSLLDRRSGCEWLVMAEDRPLQPVPYGALFHEQDMSGWDEMFPTIVACAYPGPGKHHSVALPDHGEVWTLPWRVTDAEAGRLTMVVEGRALPYQLERTLTCRMPDTLELSYRLTNRGDDAMPYIWAAHPQFVCAPDSEIVFPPQITEVCNTLPAAWGWGAPETILHWPDAVDSVGQPVRLDRVGSPALRRGRKLFALPAARPQWAGVVRRPAGDWLHLAWDAAAVPYLGLWVDEGALSRASVVAPEPTTGFYDSLAIAWMQQEVVVVAAGATHTWSLTVRLGTKNQPRPALWQQLAV